MSKKLCSGFLSVLIWVTLAAGCKPEAASQQNSSYGYFKTPFQSESQFIVEAIATDLAEQIYYAANHRLPEKKYFSVTATKKAGSPPDAPVYGLEIKLDKQHAVLKLDANIDGPIWSPVLYGDLAAALAQSAGLSAALANQESGTEILPDLFGGTAEAIEHENRTLSDDLEKYFANPQLHEQAALLLGTFLLREHSGRFFEIRSPLSLTNDRASGHGSLSDAGWFGGHQRTVGGSDTADVSG
jgi:hypothetical protein